MHPRLYLNFVHIRFVLPQVIYASNSQVDVHHVIQFLFCFLLDIVLLKRFHVMNFDCFVVLITIQKALHLRVMESAATEAVVLFSPSAWCYYCYDIIVIMNSTSSLFFSFPF